MFKQLANFLHKCSAENIAKNLVKLSFLLGFGYILFLQLKEFVCVASIITCFFGFFTSVKY